MLSRDREPITRDDRISYVSATGDIVVYDLAGRCSQCSKCLVNRESARCLCGGPFNARLEYDITSFRPVTR